MSDSFVAVPKVPYNIGASPVDCDQITTAAGIVERQRVSIPDGVVVTGSTLPAGAAKEETTQDVVGALNKILKELRLMNLHLATMTGESFTKEDVS